MRSKRRTLHSRRTSEQALDRRHGIASSDDHLVAGTATMAWVSPSRDSVEDHLRLVDHRHFDAAGVDHLDGAGDTRRIAGTFSSPVSSEQPRRSCSGRGLERSRRSGAR